MAEKNEKKRGGENISNTEWGMVIGLLALVDIVQIILDLLLQVGVIINRIIDVGALFSWTTYLKLRGVNLNGPKILSIGLTFFLEEIPDIDALPFWWLDGLVMYLTVKTEKRLKEEAAAITAAAALVAAPETGGASLVAGEAVEGGLAAGEMAEAGGAVTESGASSTTDEAEAEGGERASEGAETEGGEDDEDSGENIADEEALENQENETGTKNESKKPPKEKNNSSGNKRRPSDGGGSLPLGNDRAGRGAGASGVGSDPLDLRDMRGSAASKERAEKKRGLVEMDNLKEFGNSYRGGDDNFSKN